jgi:phosphatidylserine decarboxylase
LPATSNCRSLRECFTRELLPGARPIDRTPGVIVSPCDGIVVACGRVRDTTLIQAKGHAYSLGELLLDPKLVELHRNGTWVTIRLTAAMYHRFHAPCDSAVDQVRFIAGDRWNVNPATLSRIERVYCRNTRAIVPMRVVPSQAALTLVPVGAILVSSIRLTFVPETGPAPEGRTACNARLIRGQEMGYFEYGSTIVVLGSPGVRLLAHVKEGVSMRVGRPLFRDETGS